MTLPNKTAPAYTISNHQTGATARSVYDRGPEVRMSASINLFRPVSIAICVLATGAGCKPDAPPASPQVAMPAATPPAEATQTQADPVEASPGAAATWPADASALLALPGSENWSVDNVQLASIQKLYYYVNNSAPSIGGVACTGDLMVGDEQWGCTLATPYTVADLNIVVKAGTNQDFFYGTPRPIMVDLASLETAITSLTVESVPCAHRIRLDRDGHLQSCTLAADHSVGAWSLPAGTEISLQGGQLVRAWGTQPIRHGDTASPADPAVLLDPATGEIRGVESPSLVSAWPEGEAALAALLPRDALGPVVPLVGELEGLYGRSWSLSRTVDLAGVACKGEVQTDYSGWRCTLARPFSLAAPAVVIKAGTVQTFHFGAPWPIDVDLSTLDPVPASLEQDGVSCTGHLGLDADGHLTGCGLAAPHSFGPWTLPVGAQVSLEDGHLSWCVVATPFDFGGVSCSGQAAFAPDGQLTSCTLAAPHSFGQWTLPADTQVHLEGGRLASADVSAPVTLGDKQIPAYNTVTFDPTTGKLSYFEETSYGD